VGINPVVGLRNERIEKMVEEFVGEKQSRLAPTISASPGYLMPEGRYVEWLFEPAPFDYESEGKRMVKAIEIYGIPFMKSNATLDQITLNLEQLRFTSGDAAVYRIPIAYLLSGKTEPAVAHIKTQLVELGDLSDLAAQQYKAFASNLFQKGTGSLARHQNGKSIAGFRAKNPHGSNRNPAACTGITGQSSGRGLCVTPMVYQSTTS
jgi:hypothetical protein